MWLLFSYYSRWAPLGGDCSPVQTVDVEGLLISHHNNTRKQTCWEECQQRREGPTLPGGASLGLFPLVVLDFWMERSERCSLKGGSCWIRFTFSLFFWRYDVCDKFGKYGNIIIFWSSDVFIWQDSNFTSLIWNTLFVYVASLHIESYVETFNRENWGFQSWT